MIRARSLSRYYSILSIPRAFFFVCVRVRVPLLLFISLGCVYYYTSALHFDCCAVLSYTCGCVLRVAAGATATPCTGHYCTTFVCCCSCLVYRLSFSVSYIHESIIHGVLPCVSKRCWANCPSGGINNGFKLSL